MSGGNLLAKRFQLWSITNVVNRKSSKPVPSISDAEWEVMEVLWSSTPDRTAGDVIEALRDKRGRSPRTIKTLLGRLVKKGALAFATEGNRYLYRANVRREDCVRAESKSFLSRVFAGKAGDMLCRFVDETPLSDVEIERLRKLLDRKEGQR